MQVWERIRALSNRMIQVPMPIMLFMYTVWNVWKERNCHGLNEYG